MFTTTTHNSSIGKVLLLYFKPKIRINVNFISDILNCMRIHFRTMLGVHLIKRDGVGSTMVLMHFSLILFGSIIYVKVSMSIILGTIVHYELRTTA
jgi:hypothetical protein